MLHTGYGYVSRYKTNQASSAGSRTIQSLLSPSYFNFYSSEVVSLACLRDGRSYTPSHPLPFIKKYKISNLIPRVLSFYGQSR